MHDEEEDTTNYIISNMTQPVISGGNDSTESPKMLLLVAGCMAHPDP